MTRTFRKFRQNRPIALTPIGYVAIKKGVSAGLVPLGVLLLASSMTAMAQQDVPDGQKSLKPVVVKEKAEAPEGKDAVRAVETTIGKGKQPLRDIPQSITVVTERLIDDRNLDTVKEALKNTAGVSFQAAEGGEEDIKLRGFSLAATGDIFVDGMRDPAFYERDTFSLDRMEVLRGSASMLFGRGSTGGAVNLVTKAPRLINEHQLDVTLGSHNERRVVGDFNIKTGESAALRINAMSTAADNNGAGSSLDKKGVSATYRWGIGERDEFSVGAYHLDNNNGMNYGMPWIRPTAAQSASNPGGSPTSATTTLPLDPSAYYGMASDYNAGTATYGTLSHLHRFDADSELKTQIRKGHYTRDQRAGTVRLSASANLSNFGVNTVVNRGTNLKIQDMDTLYFQSDYQTRFKAWGVQHELLAGMDFARERMRVYADSPNLTAAQRAALYAATGLTKPATTVGTDSGDTSVNEATRVLFKTSDYESSGFGMYMQDLIQVAPHWKVLAGLRFDQLGGNYNSTAYSYSGTTGAHGFDQISPGATSSYEMNVSELSKRVGVLYQPNELHSYHLSAATSFNTSGDAYSLGASNANTPPEQSINVELGAKLDSADKRFTTRVAVFQSTKLHERNTDPTVALVTLSGRRHVVGAEIDFSGRLTPAWEIYGSYMWMPEANIDEGVAGSEGQGTRPSNTPYHSGSLWNTYQLNYQWRVGFGLNFRGRQTPIRNPGWEVPAWVTADVMVEYQASDKFTLKANVSNLTNELYADQLYSGHYIPGAGRLVQVTGTLKF